MAKPTVLNRAKVISEAKNEVEQENLAKYKIAYKDLLRKQTAAQLIVDNIGREIQDLELKMEQEIGQ